MKNRVPKLYRLAELYGVKTSYQDAEGQHQEAGSKPLMSVLKAMGAPLENISDVPGALRERKQKYWQRVCEPAAVAWDGMTSYLEIRLPTNLIESPISCRLELENGEQYEWTCNPASLPGICEEDVEGVNYVLKRMALPSDLPLGYHQFILTLGNKTYNTLVITAPQQAYLPPKEKVERNWGVFLPLYALRSRQSWAAGDIADLEKLLEWVQNLGGGLVGTLPLLAAFLTEPFEPSPYSPASRLFWNEFYLNVTNIPELKHCTEAIELLNSQAFQTKVQSLRDKPLVDYRLGFKIKREILELLSSCLEPKRQEELRKWTAKHPLARDYARFRAAVEQSQSTWFEWSQRMQNGNLLEGDYDPKAENYHLYVQWQTNEQLQKLSENARKKGTGLYLDLPLGVNNAGYDVWRNRKNFVLETDVGAPPDKLNKEGQNWGFAPLHPERIREEGYRYFIACLQNHLKYAGILRLDHVMGLHRLFWIPKGFTGKDGVYVKYHAEEFYAILALESHRHRTLLVGEDLGTVPNHVRASMAKHKIYRMYVLPFSLERIPRKGLKLLPARSLASLNTHDMPTFMTFWKKENIYNRRGLSSFLHRKGRLKAPTDKAENILDASLRHLAAGRTRICLINLEDLLLETKPQNIPGTTDEYPNWRRKASKDFEVFSRMPTVLKTLSAINNLRKRGSKKKVVKYKFQNRALIPKYTRREKHCLK